MNKKVSTSITIVLLLGLFFALVVINNQTLDSVQVDLTENQVYSLSEGSKAILDEIDEPINLYFFFSDKASKGMTSLRNYAQRVESLLQTYSKQADGKINLHLIDPEPFSEAEDQANQFGLTAATLGAAGDAIYLGMAATNALDDQETIAFFDPQQESFLEYEISKLIHKLSDPDPVKVALLTGLNIEGGQNPMTGRFDPAWTFYTQLQQLYEVEKVAPDADALPAGTDVLLLIHPQQLSASMTFAIDQFAMQGGKVLAFVDPHHESDPMAMMGAMGANSSELSTLLEAWGVSLDAAKVVLDAETGLDIRTGNGGITRHFGFLGLGTEQLDRDDVTTASLEIINGASFGHIEKRSDATVELQPLMQSSSNADLMDASQYAMTRDPSQLTTDFASQQRAFTLAARLSGRASSAYDAIPEGVNAQGLLKQTQQLNVLLVADTDLLTDRFWVQQANFFGQTVFTPFANNGDFITNSVENLSGSNALIGVRSRGTFARPFTRVEALTVVAEQKFREQEQRLQAQLEETESQLAQIQNQQGEAGALVISPEQQAAIDAFLQKKIEIRKDLRDVRHQLDKDIETLGNWLKFINVAAAPLVLMLLLTVLARLLRTNSKGL